MSVDRSSHPQAFPDAIPVAIAADPCLASVPNRPEVEFSDCEFGAAEPLDGRTGAETLAPRGAERDHVVCALRDLARAMARRLGLAVPDVEDIAQTVALRALAARRAIDEPEAWVRVVVRRRARRLGERRARFRPLGEGELSLAAPGPGPSLELLSEVTSAVAKLGGIDRTLLVGAAEGASHADLARRLELPAEQIGPRLARARHRARRRRASGS